MSTPTSLSASFTDLTSSGSRRAYCLIGSSDCEVAFESALTLGSSSGVRLLQPYPPAVIDSPPQGGPNAPQLILRGPAARSPVFDDPSGYVRYVVIAGTVTNCWVDVAPQPATGPQGNVGPAAGAALGTGADGALVYDGTTTILGVAPSSSIYTLTRDVFATNLTVNAGVTINTAGFKVFYSGTCNLLATSVVQNNGNAGGTGSAGTGGTAGAISAAGSTAQGTAGGAGGSGSAVGSNGTNVTTGAPGGTGVGGAGGTDGTNGGGTAGTWAAVAATKGGANIYDAVSTGGVFGTSAWTPLAGGSGGGGGGGSNADAGGGGGGGGGGVVILVGNILVNNGTIQANGGAGGAGISTSHNAGGGGGGGGGLVINIAASKSGSGLVQALGGAGGAKAGSSGVAGSAGTAGTVINP